MKKIFTIFLFSTVGFVAQDTLIFTRDYIPYPDTTIVFFPITYDADQEGIVPYPVVILLHGLSGNYSQWNKTSGGLQKYADEFGFIIVCPDGFYDSWYLNSPNVKNIQFQKFFIKDLLPDLYKKYKADRKNIFISGLSMGGHGAITIMLKNQDIFKAAGSTSGILDLTGWSHREALQKMLGSYNEEKQNWEDNSALHLLKKYGSKNPIIFDCGTEDFAFAVNNAFYKMCLAKEILFKFIVQPGTHNHSYWREAIKEHFKFFKGLTRK